MKIMGEKGLCLADKMVSWYMYGMAFLSVILMILLILNGIYAFVTGIGDILAIYRAPASHENAATLLEFENARLHFIAFSIVLVKAYKILISYAKYHHISIKYIVEISIVAPTVELLFNSHAYNFQTLILIGAFGIISLIIYMFNYNKFKEMD